MLEENPLYWFLPADSREVVRVVYGTKSQAVTLDALKELVDPLDRAGSKARKQAVYAAVDLGFLTIGKQNGVYTVAAPWVPLPEVLLAHPSVVGNGGAWRPVEKVGVVVPPRQGKSEVQAEAVEKVWKLFLQVTGKRFKLDAKRRKACKELAASHTLKEIEVAFRGLSESAWHRGSNDNGVEYIEPHLVARNFGMFYQMGVRDE